MKKKSSSNLGGARPGAGRKKGGMNKATLEQKIVMESIKQRVMRIHEELINSQIILAKGYLQVFKIITKVGSKGQKIKSKPELVTDELEIIDAIDFEYGSGENPSTEIEYYFVVTTPPDNRAIDSLLDRTFGKAAQSIDVTSLGDKIQGITVEFVDNDNKNASNQRSEANAAS